MPRRPRVHLDGVPLHIVQRGHNRQRCFFVDADYHCYLRWLGEAIAQCDCSLHAYVLMTNHVHLLLTPRKAGLVPKLIISLGRRYVQHVNRRYGRTGTLWDSRYKSSLVHADDYLLACQRYIELNPVRAGLAQTPEYYRWTSYHANAMGQSDALLTPHPLYLALGPEPEERRAIYRELLRDQVAPATLSAIRLALGQCQPLGDARFCAEIERRTGMRREARPRGRPPAKASRLAAAYFEPGPF